MHKLNSRYGRYLMAATLLAVLVIGGMLMSSRPVVAQNSNPGSAPVTIVAPLPLPVRDVGHLVQTPFQTTLDSSLGTQLPGSFVVPSDKRLTIEFVTGDCISPQVSTGTFFKLGIITRGTAAGHMFRPMFLLNLFDNVYGSADVTRLYADAGSSVRLGGLPFGYECTVTLSGYTTPN